MSEEKNPAVLETQRMTLRRWKTSDNNAFQTQFKLIILCFCQKQHRFSLSGIN